MGGWVGGWLGLESFRGGWGWAFAWPRGQLEMGGWVGKGVDGWVGGFVPGSWPSLLMPLSMMESSAAWHWGSMAWVLAMRRWNLSSFRRGGGAGRASPRGWGWVGGWVVLERRLRQVARFTVFSCSSILVA